MCKKRGLVTAGLCCCVSALGWAQRTEAAAGKVTICHKADSVKYFQITVGASSVPAHLRHGDCVVDDGNACTVDTCNATTGCVHTDVICNDHNPCTDDVCNGGVCVYTPDDTNSCEDGVFCNGTASCAGGTCGAVDACAAAIDLENCLVYGRCVEDSDDHCPGDPLPDCCGNGIVEDGEECETDADCPAGSTCSGCTCIITGTDPECEGQTCADFTSCNPGSGCNQPVCGTIVGGGGAGACVEGATPCSSLAPCTTSADCPGSFCFEASCCGIPVCGPPFCTDPAAAAASPTNLGAGPTFGGQ